MFGRLRQQGNLDSYMGILTEYTGTIASKGNLKIESNITGDVHGEWVIIGEKATVKGTVYGAGVIVCGRVQGNVIARELVEVKVCGTVDGDVHAPRLIVEPGGTVNGRISMNGDGAQAREPMKSRPFETDSVGNIQSLPKIRIKMP